MVDMTQNQIERQDQVDNAIHNLLQELAGAKHVPWDIDDIAIVRDAVQEVLVGRLHLMTTEEFYP
jgi:hypothetical protein